MIEVRVVDAFPDGLLRLRESMISSKKPIGKVKDQVIEVLLSSVIQIQGYLSIDLLVYSRQRDQFDLRLIRGCLGKDLGISHLYPADQVIKAWKALLSAVQIEDDQMAALSNSLELLPLG